MVIFVVGIVFVSKIGIVYFWDKYNPWKYKSPKIFPHLNSVDEFLNPVKENLDSIMEVDLIRKTFIQLNKEWIINNLGLFLQPENFLDNDEYILKLYEKLLNEVKSEENEKKKL